MLDRAMTKAAMIALNDPQFLWTDAFCLMDLPAELRNRIYGFALYHEWIDGNIMPRDSVHCTEFRTMYDGVKVNVSKIPGSWSKVSRERKEKYSVIVKLDSYEKDDNEGTASSNTDLHERLRRRGKSCSVAACHPECLCQPALTKTSRQVRAETLPIFYSINTFHIEMYNFNRRGRRSHRLPVAWWRAIGDTNLRLISKFQLSAPPPLTKKGGSNQYEFGVNGKKNAGKLETSTMIFGHRKRIDEWRDLFGVWNTRRIVVADKEWVVVVRNILRCATSVEDHGLCVEVIEILLAQFGLGYRGDIDEA